MLDNAYPEYDAVAVDLEGDFDAAAPEGYIAVDTADSEYDAADPEGDSAVDTADSVRHIAVGTADLERVAVVAGVEGEFAAADPEG